MTRIIDFTISLISIIVFLPFLLPVMIALKLTGEHDVFYLQTRVGKGGKDFKVFKFATMLRNSPNMSGGVLTQKNDSRLLPLGPFLRKSKLNELPQLINILIGDMSFVGPRPQARKHYELYATHVKECINTVRPGLTGIGSLIFRDEESMLDKVHGDRDKFHDEIITPYKGELEVWYTKNHSLKIYFLLIILTAFSVVFPNLNLHTRFIGGLPQAPSELRDLNAVE